jgi:hypothetical protein
LDCGWDQQLGRFQSAGAASLAPASKAEKIVTLRISATAQNGVVLIQIEDTNRPKVVVELDRHQAFAVAISICQAINALPSDLAVPLPLQKAVLRTKNPSFQVGIAPSGNALLALKPGPFPPLEFEFEAEDLTKLIADLRTAANVPQQHSSAAN